MDIQARKIFVFLLITLTLTVVGCSAKLETSKLSPLEQAAKAAHYTKLASESTPPLSTQYRLKAAEHWILAGQSSSATRVLRELLSTEEDPSFREQILEIRLSLLKQDTKQALALLRSTLISIGGASEDNSKNNKRIALLLPLKGSFAAPAKTIRDGFLAAYYKNLQYNPNDLTTVQVYDTGNGDHVREAYQKAIREQADIIVGPLTKPEVEIIANMPLNIPVLALNTMIQEHKNLTPQLYQFGLLPEDEVFAVVEYAKSKGHNRALIITPKGEWGQRVSYAFTQYFEKQGGTIMGFQSFTPGQDLDTIVRKVLKVEGNGHRQDFDMIFMTSTPEIARQIKSLFNRYQVDNIPVYSTSAVYSGTPVPSKDQDLNGITFCDMPWILQTNHQETRQTAAKLWPTSYSYSPRYFALGLDAYQLATELNHSRSLKSSFTGVTGTFVINEQQHIQRRLVCAKFVQGIPVPN